MYTPNSDHFRDFVWMSQFKPLKLLYLKMFLDGFRENFGNSMLKKQAKVLYFSRRNGDLSLIYSFVVVQLRFRDSA